MSPLNDFAIPALSARRVLALALVTGVAVACGSKSDEPPRGSIAAPNAGETGRGSGSGGHGGSGARGQGAAGSGAEVDDGGTAGGGGDAGEGGGTDAGEGGSAGLRGGAGATAGEPGFDEPDPGPPPVPVCSRKVTWDHGQRLELSTADDDRLEGVTPDALTLVFSAGGHFYVADRMSASDAFDAAAEVAAGLDFSSVTLSADGLRVIGAGSHGFAELARTARGEPFASTPDDSAFIPFNAAVQGTPTNEVALEPLLGLGDSVLVYSFVSPSNEDERPTLFASDWLGQWGFGQALLGAERLWADGRARRIATGLSSDGLTLFYRDDVEGEFRAAWRPRLSEPFDEYAALGTFTSAAPNGDCTELYHSGAAEDGDGDDLFVAQPLR